MKKNNKYVHRIILKYAWREDLSKKEQSVLRKWRSRSPYHQVLPDQFADLSWLNSQIRLMEEFPMEDVRQKIMARIAADKTAAGAMPLWHSSKNWKKVLIAAGIIGLFILASDLYVQMRRTNTGAEQSYTKKFNAVLTLPDSSRIMLDTAKAGRIAAAGGFILNKRSSDTLSYERTDPGTPAMAYHQLTVDTGSLMRIHLPDGTWVSLANASTIRYPATRFDSVRECYLEGEASFEVAPDAIRPFIVHANGARIEVLGTAFNITAYKDDSVTEVTLSNGSVRVTKAAATTMLDSTHFRQARITGDHIESRPLTDTAVSAIMARQGKRPQLLFVNTELKDAMRAIARRYGVTIEYKGSMQKTHVNGKFMLNNSLDETLQLINDAVKVKDVHLERSGDSLVIISAQKAR